MYLCPSLSSLLRCPLRIRAEPKNKQLSHCTQSLYPHHASLPTIPLSHTLYTLLSPQSSFTRKSDCPPPHSTPRPSPQLIMCLTTRDYFACGHRRFVSTCDNIEAPFTCPWGDRATVRINHSYYCAQCRMRLLQKFVRFLLFVPDVWLNLESVLRTDEDRAARINFILTALTLFQYFAGL